jgi:hypothetical protein
MEGSMSRSPVCADEVSSPIPSRGGVVMHSTCGDRSNGDTNDVTLAALTRICAMVGAAWLLVLSAPQVEAAIGGSATPTWPPTVAVSTTFSASVVIVNQSPPGNDTESILLTAFFVTPACADDVSVICLPGNRDPGVFDVLAAVGDASSAPCAGLCSRWVPRIV